MIDKGKMKRVLPGILFAALLLTFLSYLNNTGTLRIPGFGPVLDVIQLPAVLVGVAISGNVHMPNEPVTYAALFLTYLLLTGGLTWVAGKLRPTSAAGKS